MKHRPVLNSKISLRDFQNYYWYKYELIAFCRLEKLDKNGGKIELANRIKQFLKTGKRVSQQEQQTYSSRFDWNNENLTKNTIITDNYKNTENVRAFFKNQIGKKFKFTVTFMNWMKTSQGRTLADAIEQWNIITKEMRVDKSDKEIAAQFEYNRYIRDFLKDNPEKVLQDAIKCWKIKKIKPGDKKYKRTDLKNQLEGK